MQIDKITNLMFYNSLDKNFFRNVKQGRAEANFCPICKNDLGHDVVEFSGNRVKLNKIDEILSIKLSNAINNLPQESILVIGELKSMYLKMNIKNALKKGNLSVKKENLQNIYIINDPNFDTALIFDKLNSKSVEVVGDIRNLNCKTFLEKMFGQKYQNKEVIKYGETFETYNGAHRLTLCNSGKLDSKVYDAVFPAKSLDDKFLLLR